MNSQFDQHEMRVGRGVVFRPDRHILISRNEWLESIKRSLRQRGLKYADDLFLYIHTWTLRTVLAYWAQRPSPSSGVGVMVELEGFEGVPGIAAGSGGVKPPSNDYMRRRLMPANEQARIIRKQLIEAGRERRNARRETMQQRDDMAKHFRLKGDRATADALSRGIMPFVGDREAKGTKDLLKERFG